jgi:ribose-phosphate pyrophosphokinase
MPYQQADRNFGQLECFSLKTVTNIINNLNLAKVNIYDPHSDVCVGLIDRCVAIDNSGFIERVLQDIILENSASPIDMNPKESDIAIISTDSGSYKKISKLCDKLNFKGEIITCSKSRNHETGEITTIVPKFDETKIALIIDDIALGSRTFFNIRKELKNKYVYLAVSHGIFNENVDKLETEFTKVYTTNSRRDESVGKNIKVIEIF